MSTNILESKLSQSAEDALRGDFSTSTKKLKSLQLGIDQKDLNTTDKGEELTNTIEKTLTSVFSHLSPSTGGMDIEGVDKLLQLGNTRRSQNSKELQANAKNNKAQKDKQLDIINENSRDIDDLVRMNKDKYSDLLSIYNLIIRIIPKMRLVLGTYANTIISPDDFTKDSLNIRILDGSTNEEKSKLNRKKVQDILDGFELNKNIKDDITSYLINGRLFFLVTSVNQELKRLLNESGNTLSEDGIYSTLSSKRSSGLKSLSESFVKQTAQGRDTDNRFKNIKTLQEVFSIPEESLTEAAGKLDALIESSFIYSDKQALIADMELDEETTDNLTSFFGKSSAMLSESLNTGGPQQIHIAQASGSGDFVDTSKIKGKNRAVVRRISPANIIPLEHDGNNFGYIHLDIVDIDPDNNVLPVDGDDGNSGAMFGSSSSASGNGAAIQNIITASQDIDSDGSGRSGGKRKGYENSSQSPGPSPAEDARLRFMTDVFANRLSKEANIRLLNKSDEFKDAIYHGLSLKKMDASQRVRIVYLEPDEVVFINRGQSIFDNVIFFAKLYIASLITLLLQNVLRGGDQRVVYVEVGLDNNGAHAVQEVIKNLKSREISSVLNMDLQTVMNIQSQFKDYFVPVVNGEKPIAFDTISNDGNKSLDDDFLNWLGGNIFSGMGIPAAYLTEVENIDFAKSLSMQNSRFLRDVISEQSTLSRGYTDLVRKIVEIEHNEEITRTRRRRNANNDLEHVVSLIDTSELAVLFPAPSSLSLMNISDQMQTAISTLTQIIETVDLHSSGIKEEKQEEIRQRILTRILREYVTSFDWNFFQNVVDDTITDITTKDSVHGNDEEDE